MTGFFLNLYFGSRKKLLWFFISVIIISNISLLPLNFINKNNLPFPVFIIKPHQVFAQEHSNMSNNNLIKSDSYSNYNNISTQKQVQQKNNNIIASGHFANNQIEDGIVTWIQGGYWNLEIKNMDNNSTQSSNKTANFEANFTMIKPNGDLSHNHTIDNFISNNIIFANKDIVITGLSNIHSNEEVKYTEVPITIHLMGKKVLGLMIDVNKTKGHFSSSNEMYGTLISGIGLDEHEDENTNNHTKITKDVLNIQDNNMEVQSNDSKPHTNSELTMHH